jgi:hypothetical protein
MLDVGGYKVSSTFIPNTGHIRKFAAVSYLQKGYHIIVQHVTLS